MNMFYRCDLCFHVVALNDEEQNKVKVCRRFLCGLCETGKMRCMGFARQKRIVRQEDRCECNSHCTFATGPNCDCICGGKNHGSNRLVTVIVDAGKNPTFKKPENAGKLLEQFNEFTALAFEIKARADNATKRYVEGGKRDRRLATVAMTYQMALNDAMRRKVHHVRMADLKRVMIEEHVEQMIDNELKWNR